MDILNLIWNYLPSIIVFILIFSLLVLIHECGHFFSALHYKVTVEEFGLGIPPRAKIIAKKKGIIYSLNWIPFGGFVKMLGEDDLEGKNVKNKGSFSNKRPYQRLIIVLAGVTMNFLLAIGLLTVGYSIGMSPIATSSDEIREQIVAGELESEVIITGIVENSPANQAGLEMGDVILQINGEPVIVSADVTSYAKKHPEETTLTYSILDTNNIQEEITIELDENGKAGIMIGDKTGKVQYNPARALVEATKTTGKLSVMSVEAFADLIKNLINKHEISEDVGGPVMIASMTHHLVQLGDIMILLQFTALLSISLGVINLLPIPALDGGRAVFILFEMITGKRANEKVEAILHQVFFLLLIGLIFAITYHDIFSLFG